MPLLGLRDALSGTSKAHDEKQAEHQERLKQHQDSIGKGPRRRKALIVGCNYRGSSAELKGCINDAHMTWFLLKTKFGFTEDQLMFLTDDNPRCMPTRARILQGIQWLVSDQRPGDELWFSFSGHGSQVRDGTGIEKDGKCETLCPTDFKRAGMIVDKELNQLLIRRIKQGVTLHALIDACHSGTVLDLEHSAQAKTIGQPKWLKSSHQTNSNYFAGTSGGLAIQFAAAREDQTAADTSKLSGTASTGAATYCFIQAIEKKGTNISYGELLDTMHSTLKSVGRPDTGKAVMHVGKNVLFGAAIGLLTLDPIGGAINATVNGAIATGQVMSSWKDQTPTLSSNIMFDLKTPLSL